MEINWDDTFIKYKRQVRNTVSSILLDEDDINDIVSETFLKGMEKEYLFDVEKAAINTWLCTIAKNFALQKRKKNKELLL
jgi:DNA-directed RNA polymerase specialized sigma24 family protein